MLGGCIGAGNSTCAFKVFAAAGVGTDVFAFFFVGWGQERDLLVVLR